MTVFLTWIWDISVLDHSATTVGWILHLFWWWWIIYWTQITEHMKHSFLIRVILVSTAISGILFVHFHIVDHATDKSIFSLWCHGRSKKVPVKRESSRSLRGYDVAKKVWYGRKMVDYTKMNKKNSRCYSRDYCYAMWHGLGRPPGGLPSLFFTFFRWMGWTSWRLFHWPNFDPIKIVNYIKDNYSS